MSALDMVYKNRSWDELVIMAAGLTFAILVAVLYGSVAQIEVAETDKNSRVVRDAKASFTGIWVMMIIIAALFGLRFANIQPFTLLINKITKKA
jgi:hypothetical protein